MPRSNSLRNRTYAEAYGATPTPTPQQVSDAERDRLEYEFMRDMDDAAAERDAVERSLAEARATVRPRTSGQLILNKTQLREIMAHSQVWDYVPGPLRTRINNSVASNGVLFQLTNSQRTELRNALAHGRSRRAISNRLIAIFNQASRWS